MGVAMAEPGAGLVRRPCPACGAVECAPLPAYSRSPWTVVECKACSFVYLRDAPIYEELVDTFAWEKSHAEETERRKAEAPKTYRLRHQLRNLHRIGKKGRQAQASAFAPGPVLDIGCGPLDIRIPGTNTPYGLEISRQLHAEADRRMKARGGYAVHAPAVEGIKTFPDSFFSGAILSSYLEHEMQPRELLAQLARVIKPGGKAYVRVPNYGGLNRRVRGGRWCGFRHPDHVNYFTLSSLRAMAGEFGFGLAVLQPLVLPFNDNINAMLTR